MTQRANIEGFGVIPLVNPNTCTVGAMEDLQDDTGWDDEEIQRRVSRATSRTAMMLFLSLRDAGHTVSYEDVRKMPQGTMQLLEEPTDRKAKKKSADPTKAPRASARGAVDEQPTETTDQP